MLIASLLMLQVIIFAGLILILKRIITQNVISATRQLETLEGEYRKKDEEVSRRLEEAGQKSRETIDKAREEADRLKIQLIKEAEAERERMLKDARAASNEIIEQADRSKELLLGEANERISKQAVDKACELIQNTLPDKFKEDVHSHWIDELTREGFDRLEGLRIPEDTKEVKVISPIALKERDREMISERLKKVLGRDVSLVEEVDPRIVAGIIISVGGLVLDGSLKNKIIEKTKHG